MPLLLLSLIIQKEIAFLNNKIRGLRSRGTIHLMLWTISGDGLGERGMLEFEMLLKTTLWSIWLVTSLCMAFMCLLYLMRCSSVPFFPLRQLSSHLIFKFFLGFLLNSKWVTSYSSNFFHNCYLLSNSCRSYWEISKLTPTIFLY